MICPTDNPVAPSRQDFSQSFRSELHHRVVQDREPDVEEVGLRPQSERKKS